MTEPRPTYTHEEMDAILKRALERQQAQADGIGHEELVEAAAEVGIGREEVEAAARDLAAEKSETAARPQMVRSGDRGREVRRFLRSALTWLVFSGFFYALCAATGASWWIWPVMGWGLAVALQAVHVFLPRDVGSRHDRRSERRESRRERRQRRREERVHEFERRVEIGADALVRVIEEMRRLKDAERAGRDRTRVAAPPPAGVRVDARETEAVNVEEGTEERAGKRAR